MTDSSTAVSANNQKKGSAQIMLVVLGILWLFLGGGIIYSGVSQPPTIEINWETESEYDTAGFNIYRSDTPDGQLTQINPQLIPSQADPASGASYSYVDETVEAGQTYYYVLEDVEYSNVREQHDVIIGEAAQFEWIMVALAAVSFVLGLGLLATGIKELRQL